MTRHSRLVLDVLLSVAFVFAYSPSVTGIAVHEWLGLALLVPAFVHCVVNWDWSVRVASRFFERLRATSRINLVVDALLFAATVAVTLSGLMVSRVVAGLFGGWSADAVWHVTHSVSATAVIVLFAVHTALHAPWIVSAARSLVAEQPAPPVTDERSA